ncbi:terminase gpA endonuclease subunit [Bradyrhizobium sp.]|uniref:phage terminase large subunit family protein n=1 Tax=Bradyrhizobium sp. TaxID=376 RepID=UPI0025BE808F|nr:terminase gpA endonuclease subunit [Bradyrhizobium sp.]
MIDGDLAQVALRAFAPPPIILPSDFVQAELRLPASSNAIPGRLVLSTFQKEIVDSIVDDGVTYIVLMLASQIGKSLAVDSQMLSMIATLPGPFLHVSPDSKSAEKLVRTRIDPLIAASPMLRKIVGRGPDTRKGHSGGTNSLTAKSFSGGSLDFVSSYQPSELAARSVRCVWMDEIDRFNPSAGKEGDPVLLAAQRTERFVLSGRKIVLVSTPTTLQSRIASWYERGDKRKFFIECPHCKHSAPITFEQLHYEKGKPETAALTCGACGVVHSETSRLKMLATGKWIATAVGEKGIRSYQMPALGSEHISLESVARKWEAATTAEAKQVFYNVVLAEPFDSSIEYSMSSLELRERSEPIKSPYSRDIQFVTAGVDVQDSWLEVQFIGHHANEITTILNHHRLDGDTFSKAVWGQLAELIGQSFPLEDGRKLPVAVTAVDSGHRPDAVIDFVFSQIGKQRRVVAVKGVAGFNRPFIDRGGRLKKRLGLYLVGVDSVKASLYSRMRRLEYGPGFIHVPDHLPDEFYTGLASEALETTYVHGFPRYRFKKIVQRNEVLDACTYGHAVAGLVDRRIINAPAKPEQSIKELAARLHAAHNN